MHWMKRNKLKETKIRLACIGLGWITTQVWLPNFLKQKSVDLCGVLDTDVFAIQNFSKLFGNVQFFDNIDSLIKSKPDLVIIATPNIFHADLSAKLIENGISILVEKPFSVDLNSFYKVKSAFNKNPFPSIFVSQAVRYRDDIQTIKKIIVSGIIGKINTIELSWVRSKGVPKPGSWFTNQLLSGGGAFIDIGWHLLDTSVFLLGNQPIDSVSSFKSNTYLSNTNYQANWRIDDKNSCINHDMNVEDTMIAFVKTKNNTSIQLNVAWASHYPVDRTSIALHGDDGAIILETTFGFSPNRVLNPKLTLYKHGDEKLLELKNEKVGYEYELHTNDIINSLMSGSPDNQKTMAEMEYIVQLTENIYAHAKYQ